MPLYNPGILATGGSVAGNVAVSGTQSVGGILTASAGVKSTLSNVLTPTFSTGVAAQLSDTTVDYMVYLEIGSAGTAFSVAIGPTSTPSHTIVASGTATTGEVVSFRLPAAWYVLFAITTGTIANQIAISA
jgi:hypothetical protein